MTHVALSVLSVLSVLLPPYSMPSLEYLVIRSVPLFRLDHGVQWIRFVLWVLLCQLVPMIPSYQLVQLTLFDQ